MKRTIAILLTLLFCILALSGCGRSDNNVSERNDGMIEENNGPNAADTLMPDNTEDNHNKNNNTDGRTNDIQDDAERVIDDTGDVIEDIGRDIGDAVTGEDDSTQKHSEDMK